MFMSTMAVRLFLLLSLISIAAACETYNLQEWEQALTWCQHLPILQQYI